MTLPIKVIFIIALHFTISFVNSKHLSNQTSDWTDSRNVSTTSENWFFSFFRQIHDSITGSQNDNEVSEFNETGVNFNANETDVNGTFYNLDSAMNNVMNVGMNFVHILNNTWLSAYNDGLDLTFDSSYPGNDIDYDQLNDTDRFWWNTENENNTVIQSAMVLMNGVKRAMSTFGNDTHSSNSESPSYDIWSINGFVPGIQDMIVSPWMNKSIDHISGLFDNFRSKMTYKDNNFLVLLFILQRIQQLSEQNNNNQGNSTSSSGNHTLESLDIFHIKRYGAVAFHVYTLLEHSNHEIAARLGIEDHDVLKTMVFDDISDQHCPSFIIYVDHEDEAIVMGIRGTWSIDDIVLDLVGNSVPFLEGWTHKGMLQGARKVINESEDILREAFRKFPNYTFVLCGHSLGGGTAELITLDLLYGESGKRLEATKRNLYKTFTFGAPPIFTSNHSRIPIEVPEIISLVNRADVVPSLSLGTIEKTLEQISSLDSLEFTLEEKSQMMFESLYHDFQYKCSEAENVIEGYLKASNLKENLENMFKKLRDTLGWYLPNSINFLQNTTSFSLIRNNDIKEQPIKNDTNVTAPIDQRYFPRNKTHINHSMTNEEDESFDENRNYKDKIVQALEILNNWDYGRNHTFLQHPGRMYQIDDIMDDKDEFQGCKNTQVVQKLSHKEKNSLIRNIRLNMVNMITDHSHYSYMNAMNKMYV